MDRVRPTAIPAADYGRLARAARVRAGAAADRAEQLQAARRLRERGSDAVICNSDDLLRARQRADDAHLRLVAALRRSAAAHDRAADTLHQTGRAAVQQRVREHREAALIDRTRADQLASATSYSRPPPPAVHADASAMTTVEHRS